MPMTLSQLTDEMNHFVTAKGWYAAGSRAPQTPRNIAARSIGASYGSPRHSR